MNRVVVTGLGAVTPLGNDVPSMWEAMKAGKCGIDFITRFDTTEYKAKVAAEVKNFDPLKYIEKSELRKTDLYCQYALCAAGEAMDDSGLIGKIAPERFGVYVGSGIGGMQTFVSQTETLRDKGPKRVSPHFIPMMISNIAAGRIAIKYQAKGPSMSVVTACATSSNTIGEAFHAIKHGYADAILAGGAEATITPLAVAGFVNCMALSNSEDPSQASIPFDKRRDGFVMGEGAGMMVLEEYEHAKARGAKIYAEIVGYGNTNDAYHVTAPDPDGAGASNAMRIALEESGRTENDLLYINAHGTSTPLNDKGETAAIKQVLGKNAYDVLVSSTKSMTGHMLGATGAVEAIASVLALDDGIVPPTIGYREPDPECDLNYVPNQAIKADIQYAASNSLGFGGHNACIVFKKI